MKLKLYLWGGYIAKKKYVTIDDLKYAVYFVPTFVELDEIFKALNINILAWNKREKIEVYLSWKDYERSSV